MPQHSENVPARGIWLKVPSLGQHFNKNTIFTQMCLRKKHFTRCACKIILLIAQIVEVCLQVPIHHYIKFNLTCKCKSAMISNLILSLCQTRIEHSSKAVTETWKYSSVVTPNHSGESRNWFCVIR